MHVGGPGAHHPEAGQPIPFRLGGPLHVARAIEAGGTTGVDLYFRSPLPDGSGWMSGGGSGMGRPTAVFTNDWRNRLTLDLTRFS